MPAECRDLAVLVASHHGKVHRAAELGAAAIVRLLQATDAVRRPGRFEQLLEACACDYHGRLGWQALAYTAPALLRQALAQAGSIDAAAIVRGCTAPATIPCLLYTTRCV